MVRKTADRCKKEPPLGNYGGSTYTVTGKLPEDDEITRHEGQASPLASQAGGILLDYCRCRLSDTPAIRRELRQWVGAMTERKQGWRGWYDRSWTVLEGGIVAACSDPKRAAIEGLLVDLPGRACACLGEDLPGFLLWCTERGRMTRADFAIDDRAGLLTRDRILEAEAGGGMVTRWRNPMTDINQRELGKVVSWTLYLGDRAGECIIRFYDKAAQQGVEGPWVRCELETKGGLADALCREYFDQGGGAIIGQINRRLRFVVPIPGDSNNRRWPAVAWWVAFLGTVQPGRSLLAGEKPKTTVESMRHYVEVQAGPGLAAVLEHDGDWLWLKDLVDKGRDRWQPKHIAAIEAAKCDVLGGEGCSVRVSVCG
jgi:hypothetical protein